MVGWSFYAALLALQVTGGDASYPGPGPQPLPMPAPIEAPRDRPFRGSIHLAVDASDTAHKVYRVHESIPVQRAGDMTLLYPAWETASHAPTASVSALAGLVVRAGGKRIEWQRDPVDMSAFHIDVPVGATQLDLDFEFLSPLTSRQGPVAMTPDIVTVPWHRVLLYPAGWFARDITFDAALTLPSGFTPVTSLDRAVDGQGIVFSPVPLDVLVDSPVYAARQVSMLNLSPHDHTPINLAILGNGVTDALVTPAQLKLFQAMVVQTQRLLPKRHFGRYDFIVALTDTLPGPGGIEHAQSSENTLPTDFFTHWDNYLVYRDLLPHEFVHSWNGRYRQPADMWTANFNTPMRDSLLWVYEGQTEFWSRILAARAGLRTTQETLDALAVDAAQVQLQSGRAWKSLQDSSNDPIFAAGHPMAWRDWQRREDYYGEGVLLWLAVDAVIREQTRDRKSLDDFAAAFFGGHDGDLTPVTYTFDDVCAALDRVAPYDWHTFLRTKLDDHEGKSLLEGLGREGYRLVFTDKPTDYFRQKEADNGASDFSTSIGVDVTRDGAVTAVAWDGPAFRAGLSPGARIDRVNGETFSIEQLEVAIKRSPMVPLRIAFRQEGTSRTAEVAYRGSLRYPRLERVSGTQDRLQALLKPRH